MKRFILAAALILSMALASSAKANSEDAFLIKSLTAALQSAQTINKHNTNSFNITSFDFKGNTVNAYYDVTTNDLLGFSIPIQSEDLPNGTVEKLYHKYGNCSLITQMVFVDIYGSCTVYISLSRPEKRSIVVSLSNNGRSHYFSKM